MDITALGLTGNQRQVDMDFDFSPEHDQVREMVRRLAAEEIAPLAAAADDNERFPRDLFAK